MEKKTKDDKETCIPGYDDPPIPGTGLCPAHKAAEDDAYAMRPRYATGSYRGDMILAGREHLLRGDE